MKHRHLLGLVLLAIPAAARAADPFVYTETTTTGTPQTVQIDSHSVIRATDDLLLGLGSGATLYGRDVTASLKYGGVADALRITVSADHTTATLSYPGTGRPAETFVANGGGNYFNPAQSLDNQIYNAITDPHNRDWEDLQNRLNRESFIMPADGNPSAATSFLAEQTFNRFALLNDQIPPGGNRYSNNDDPEHSAGYYSPNFALDIGGQRINTTGFDGYDLEFTLSATGRFLPWLGYSFAVPYQVREVAGAQSQTLGFEFGLPFDLIRTSRRNPVVSWTLTPYAEFAVNDSPDLGSTVGIFDAGLASRLAFRFGPRRDWAFAWGSQFTGFVGLHEGRNTDLYGDDYDYDGRDDYYSSYNREAFRGHVSQQLFKNGLQVVHDFRHGLSVDASVTYSSFVENAAVDQWWTPRIGLGWQITRNFGVRWDYSAELANHYTSSGGRFELDFRY
jgi:hypothetical protein